MQQIASTLGLPDRIDTWVTLTHHKLISNATTAAILIVSSIAFSSQNPMATEMQHHCTPFISTLYVQL